MDDLILLHEVLHLILAECTIYLYVYITWSGLVLWYNNA